MIDVGTQIPPFIVESVPTEPMKTMAFVIRDPNPIHWDESAVRSLGLGEKVINQGPTNQAYIINALINWLGDPSALRSMHVRFRGNVYAEERVEAGGEVTAIDPDTGLATLDVWLDGPNGRVISGVVVVKVS